MSDPFKEFVEEMARLAVPEDDTEENRRRREAAASESGTPIDELDESDIIACGFVIVTTRGLRMAWHAEGQSVAKPRGRATRPARPSVSVCKPRGSRDDAPG
jgi:hypothetical protein